MTRREELAYLVEARLGLNLARAGLADALAAFAERHEEGFEAEPDDDRAERFQRLVDAVTVQHSWLFRDLQQLEAACAALHIGAVAGPRLQAWVPACATGEDAYSVVALCHARGLDVDVLGTDIHAQAVERARQAYYGPFSTRSIPEVHRHLLRGVGAVREVAPAFRSSVRFDVHNLLAPPPRSQGVDGKWDLILCRNVLFYFTPAHAAGVLARLAAALTPTGTLVLGASDILTDVPPGLVAREIEGRVVFQRASQIPALPLGGPVAGRSSSKVRAAHGPAPVVLDPTPRAAAQDLERYARAMCNEATRLPAPPLPPQRSPAPGAHEDDGDTEHAVAHLHDGVSCHLSGELDAAVVKLRAALYLAPDLWPAAYYLALTYDDLGRADEARREYAHVSRCIEAAKPLPQIAGQNFSFLALDIAEIARRRAARQ